MKIFLLALAFIESSHNATAYNKPEDAVGWYQIRPMYLKDANDYILRNEGFRKTHKIPKGFRGYKHSEMQHPLKATIVTLAYLERYGKFYTKTTGKRPTFRVLARIHNGGPYGWRKRSTIKYAERVLKAMDTQPWK